MHTMTLTVNNRSIKVLVDNLAKLSSKLQYYANKNIDDHQDYQQYVGQIEFAKELDELFDMSHKNTARTIEIIQNYANKNIDDHQDYQQYVGAIKFAKELIQLLQLENATS